MSTEYSYTLGGSSTGALTIYAGWDFALIGTFTLEFSDAGGTHTATFNASSDPGTFAHVDLSPVLGTDVYADFASALETEMTTQSGGGRTYTVTFDASTLLYTISASVSFVITNTTNTLAKNLLGFTGLPTSSAASHVGTIRPYYVISASMGGRNSYSGDYEPDGHASDAVADDGTAYQIAYSTFPTLMDFRVVMESREATYSAFALSGVPWTYQHLWQHARGIEPLLFSDDLEDVIVKLRDEGSSFHPEHVIADFEGLFNLQFRTRVEGRL